MKVRTCICTDGCPEALKKFIRKWQGFKNFEDLYSIKIYCKYPKKTKNIYYMNPSVDTEIIYKPKKKKNIIKPTLEE